MTPEEINQRISTWVGITSQYACHADGEVDETCVIDLNERHDCVYASNIETKEQCERWMQRRDTPTPDYFGSNAAMDLLGALESQGYWWEMGNFENGDEFIKIGSWYGGLIVTAQRPAISAAICHAIIELIEREGGL